MLTYSINTATTTEATTYPLIGATSTDLSVPLSILYDNTTKQISPYDLRSTILTLWSNSVFSHTQKSGIEYIGIDTSNPSDRDLKNKIYFGKRAFSGTYSYTSTQDIMSSTLLNSDVDIFLYNTKRDTLPNAKTRASILAGTNSSLWLLAPYIQAETISSTTSLSLDIINPSLTGGNIYVSSTFSGTASINNIVIPSWTESGASASDGKLLRYYNGKTEWDFIQLPPLTTVGTTGSMLNMYGNPVLVNGYPLEFSDTRYCPIDIGDILIGTTFSNIMAVELLRRIVYDYLPPTCALSILAPNDTGYVEVGSSPIIKLKYVINKRTLPTNITGLTNMIPSSYPAITTNEPKTVTGTASGIIISPVPNTTFYFSINVSDTTKSNGATVSLSGIYPYFYGFSSLSSINFPADLLNLSKSVTPLENKSFDITGSGNLYFIYDATYPDLTLVYDNNLTVIPIPSGQPTIKTLSSPTGLWASKQFKIYKWTGFPQVGPPSVIYQFIY